MSDEMKRTYKVVIEELTTREFVIEDVNSAEEAEGVAEDWLADGEDGTILGSEIYDIDSFPIDDEEEDPS